MNWEAIKTIAKETKPSIIKSIIQEDNFSDFKFFSSIDDGILPGDFNRFAGMLEVSSNGVSGNYVLLEDRGMYIYLHTLSKYSSKALAKLLKFCHPELYKFYSLLEVLRVNRAILLCEDTTGSACRAILTFLSNIYMKSYGTGGKELASLILKLCFNHNYKIATNGKKLKDKHKKNLEHLVESHSDFIKDCILDAKISTELFSRIASYFLNDRSAKALFLKYSQ